MATSGAFAVQETSITSPWILRLDADYQLTDALVAELDRLDPDAAVSAYQLRSIMQFFQTSFCRRFIHQIRFCYGGASFQCGTKVITKRGLWKGLSRNSTAASYMTIGSRLSNG